MPSNSHFFKPTGFEESFVTEPAVNLGGLPTTHKKTVEDAVRHVDVANDAFGAVSMSLEPGSGKTTVFPFRFAESKVCVILPTGFDALCAFRLASGPANLATPNVKEDNGANVTYMDSYSAGFMCFKYKGGMPFDIVIVDESDSNAGITKTLTEIRFKSCYVIHLSGTPEGRETVYSTGFPVESYSTLPELSETYFDAVDFIKTRSSGKRGMVMVPNSKVARQIHHMIKNSRIIDTESTVEELDLIVKQQSSKEELIVADDSCVRGFNLNLDVVFDFQQTGTAGNMRNITKHEHQQRRMRVGRMKQGQYYYSPVVYSDTAFTQWDVFRNNVARAVFGLPLEVCSLQLDVDRLKELMVSRVEPFVLQQSLPELVSNPEPVPIQQQQRRRSSALSDNAPGWMLWASGYRGTLTRKHVRGSSGSSSGSKAVTSGSGSSSSVGPDNSVSQVGVSSPSTGASTVPSHGGKFLARPAARAVAKPEESWTPVIDLGEGGCVEWPEALRAAYSKGDKLCMVKPASWVYTGHAASVDYTQRLLNVIRDGPTFSEPEMEIVCRAWNVMVSRMNFAFARGRDAWGDNERVGFILDYFVSYNNMMLT